VCNPAAVTAAEELHARSKGYSTSVFHLRRENQRNSDQDNSFKTSAPFMGATGGGPIIAPSFASFVAFIGKLAFKSIQ
jgi:hypothetical protein